MGILLWDIVNYASQSRQPRWCYVLCRRTDMEGSHEKGESQEVQVGVHKDAFDLVGVLLCETCNTETHGWAQRAESGSSSCVWFSR